MTLPATGPISMSQVSVELGLASNYPMSLDHSWLRALAQVGGAGTNVSISSLHGKGATWNGPTTTTSTGGPNPSYTVSFSPLAPFFGGALSTYQGDPIGPCYVFSTYATSGGALPNWPGNIRITNQSTGQSVIATPYGSPAGYGWTHSGGMIMRAGATADIFLVTPA